MVIPEGRLEELADQHCLQFDNLRTVVHLVYKLIVLGEHQENLHVFKPATACQVDHAMPSEQLKLFGHQVQRLIGFKVRPAAGPQMFDDLAADAFAGQLQQVIEQVVMYNGVGFFDHCLRQ